MKVLLDIQDNKASFIIELLKNFSFIKTTQLSDSKTKLTKTEKKAIDEGLKAIDEGKITSHEQVMKETKKRYPDFFK